MSAQVIALAEEIKRELTEQNVTVLQLYGPYETQVDPELPDEEIDLAVAIGGDGTMLKAARICAARRIPILPVKMGHFGFISDIQHDEWRQAFEMYKAGTLQSDDHQLLCAMVGDKIWWALNDITIQSVVYGTIQTRIFCNGEFLSDYRSDGIIVSTATGSTAHSLSIGGPVIVPAMDVMMINPIAPFALSHRPLIVPMRYAISITLKENQRTGTCLIADGRVIIGMTEGSTCHIKGADVSAKFLKSPKRSYFDVLRNKLKWGGSL